MRPVRVPRGVSGWGGSLKVDPPQSAAVAPGTPGFVEENGGGIAHVEGVHPRLHRDDHLLVAGGQDFGSDSLALGTEHDAAVFIEAGVGKKALVRVWMGGEAADAVLTELVEGDRQRWAEQVGHPEQGSHARAHRPAQIGMGGGFPDDQGLDAHRRGIPQDEANIHGVGD